MNSMTHKLILKCMLALPLTTTFNPCMGDTERSVKDLIETQKHFYKNIAVQVASQDQENPDNWNWSPYCGGYRVAPQWVIVSASCIQYYLSQVPEGVATAVGAYEWKSEGNNGSYSISKDDIYYNTRYLKEVIAGRLSPIENDRYDIALVKLNTPSKGALVEIATQVNEDQALAIEGFKAIKFQDYDYEVGVSDCASSVGIENPTQVMDRVFSFMINDPAKPLEQNNPCLATLSENWDIGRNIQHGLFVVNKSENGSYTSPGESLILYGIYSSGNEHILVDNLSFYRQWILELVAEDQYTINYSRNLKAIAMKRGKIL